MYSYFGTKFAYKENKYRINPSIQRGPAMKRIEIVLLRCPANIDIPSKAGSYQNQIETATKRFGKWEAGAIGFYATDISKPISDYHMQSKAAIGGLVGYWFGPVIWQVYVTTEVYESNYGGKDTRLWSRLVIPFGKPPAPGYRPFAP